MIFKFILFYLPLVVSYKPVILLHGVMTGFDSMELIKSRIEEVSLPIVMCTFNFMKSIFKF